MENDRSIKQYGFFWLLIAIFLLRGVAIQCLYPPLEGADEYQHIAVIHYLAENRALPVYGQAMVPVSLYDDIVANPHPNHSADQTRGIGAQSYEIFYDNAPVRTSDVPIGLYQAQHPPLYYLMMAPLYSWSRSVMDFRSTVYLLRFINLVVAAFALILLIAPIKRMVFDYGLCRLYLLIVAVSPMYLIYISRVSNDAFALLFAGMSFALVLGMPDRKRVCMTACLAGVCGGFAVLSKLIGLVVLPVVVTYWIIVAVTSKNIRRYFFCCIMPFFVGYLLVSLPYHMWALEQYGTLLPSQETLKTIAAGQNTLGWLREVRLEHVWVFFIRGIILRNLWTSGWSFLLLPKIAYFIYSVLLFTAGCGCMFWLRKRSRTAYISPIRDWRPLWLFFLLIFATCGAMYIHALQALASYGRVTTPAHYFMIAYPAFLSVFLIAALGFGRRFASRIALTLLVFLICAEVYGLCFVAVPHWAQSQDWGVIMSRLSLLHPIFPAPVFFFILYPFALVLLFKAVRTSFAAR